MTEQEKREKEERDREKLRALKEELKWKEAIRLQHSREEYRNRNL